MEKVATCIFAARFTQQNYPKKNLVSLRGIDPVGMGAVCMYISTCIHVYTYMVLYIYFLKLFVLIF